MTKPRDIISYLKMCEETGTSLQRGMNYHLQGVISTILMSRRPNAPYTDTVMENGRILIYEGHDASRTTDTPNPKIVDQPMKNPNGGLTQNGQFWEAANRYKLGKQSAELIRVYEKLYSGIWVYNGLFKLTDAWQELSDSRKVFKFKLELTEIDSPELSATGIADFGNDRMIPSKVKLEVWQRDKGKCVVCGSTDNLHFDHIIPFSKGGSSLVADNIQILCARHNLAKRDKIE